MEDLKLMISEAKRMANTFKAFEKIPRVLEVIQSSSSFVDGLEKTAEKKKKEITDLEGKIEKTVEALGLVEDRIKEKGEELKLLGDTVDRKKAVLIADMGIEIENLRGKATEKLEKSNLEKAELIAKNEKAMNDSEVDMIETINFHKAQIEKFEGLAQVAEMRAEEAELALEKIKKSLLGGD